MSLIDQLRAWADDVLATHPEAGDEISKGMNAISIRLVKLLQKSKCIILDEIRAERKQGRYAVQMLLLGEMQQLTYLTFEQMQPMMTAKHKGELDRKDQLGIFCLLQLPGAKSLPIKVFTIDDQRAKN